MPEPTETSPLLAPEVNDVSSSDEAAPDSTPSFPIPASEHFKRQIKIITHIIILAAAIDLVLIVATILIVNYDNFDRWTTENLEYLGILTFLSLILSCSNLKLVIPNLLNLILDIVLAFNLLNCTSEIIGGRGWPASPRCGPGSGYRPSPPSDVPAHCSALRIALNVLVCILTVLSAIIGISHSVLFVSRVVAGIRAGLWRRSRGLYIPTGELTFSFTVKFLKQQPPPAGPVVDVDAA